MPNRQHRRLKGCCLLPAGGFGEIFKWLRPRALSSLPPRRRDVPYITVEDGGKDSTDIGFQTQKLAAPANQPQGELLAWKETQQCSGCQ